MGLRRAEVGVGATALGLECSAARLILDAGLPWSPQAHGLFPEEARARAVVLLRLGFLLFLKEPRFEKVDGAAGLFDLWCASVGSQSVRR